MHGIPAFPSPHSLATSKAHFVSSSPSVCNVYVSVWISQGGPVMTVEEELEMKKLKARVHVLFEDNWRNGTCTRSHSCLHAQMVFLSDSLS
jgi:hypothetical protein